MHLFSFGFIFLCFFCVSLFCIEVFWCCFLRLLLVSPVSRAKEILKRRKKKKRVDKFAYGQWCGVENINFSNDLLCSTLGFIFFIFFLLLYHYLFKSFFLYFYIFPLYRCWLGICVNISIWILWLFCSLICVTIKPAFKLWS